MNAFTARQIADWRAFEKVRAGGRWNMFSREAHEAAGLRRVEALFVMQHYTALKEAAASALLVEIERRHALGEIRMNRNTGEFSVWRFFPDGTYEALSRFVSVEEALATAGVCAALAVTKKDMQTTRLIITDGGDCTVFEWERGRGVTYPPPVSNN